MARQKLSEYKAKIIVSDALRLDYKGWGVSFSNPLDVQTDVIMGSDKYVVKVDQGIKGRFKKGLVILDVNQAEIKSQISKLHDKGYDSFIVEPQASHDSSEERYLALSYSKSGTTISYSKLGGIEIESNTDSIKSFSVDDSTDWANISKDTGFSTKQLETLCTAFNDNFMTMLEINPYLVTNESILPLDAAIEVDDAGSYFVKSWTPEDFRRSSSKKLTEQELLVQKLDEDSPASLKLEVINPNGSVFLLLSGGGASVVVADEICNLGIGAELANYGEYSGNPNTEETYLYTKALLSLLIESSAPKKVLFIGGAVANFTDIANTFKGIIQAIDELAAELKKEDVKIFVRRGGPRQEIGLAKIKATLESHGLMGAVHDPSTPLTQAVAEAVEAIK